jgi:hypothetical protein
VPYSNIKSWEPWSFTEVPDFPQIQTPNIIWVQKEAHIKLISDAPLSEPSFICLSKVLENEPIPRSQRGPFWRELPVSRTFFYMSLEFLIKVLLIN